MTTRVKTLWFATEKSDASVADATLTALPQITVYAENSSRTFRAALVWVHYSDMSTATGATVGEHRVACSVNGAGATTITELDDITNSGENMAGWLGPFDFTSHFTSNFPAASSATLDLSVYFDITTGTGLTTNNIGALIALTYEFDDSAATQYATAIVPMESLVGAMGTAEAEIGTNQIPKLTGTGGLLENVASVVVRQQFFVVEGNDESAATATNYTLNTRIDTGTTKTFQATVKNLASDSYRAFIHIESPAAGSAHAWKAWTTGAGRLNHAAHTMYVTYEFAVSGTTEWLNSILIPFEIASPMGGTASGDRSRFRRTFTIPEPATITLKQSAVRLHFVAGAANLGGLNVAVGSQAFRAYTNNVSMVCGGSVLQQRIDSGSAQGAGISLARGDGNTITIDCYRTDATDLGWNLTGVIILNYKSGVSASGIWAHTHTTWWKVLDWDAALTSLREAAAMAPNIPEANWWLTAIGYHMVHWDTASANGIQWEAEILAGEGMADGWRDLYADIFVKDAERACQIVYCRARDAFDRHPGDTDTDRLALEGSRKYRYANAATCAKGVAMIVTYHSITFTLSGTISGSGGGTVNIYVKKAADPTREVLFTTSRVGNGAYSVTVYDDVADYAVDAFEDDTHVGASAEAVV